MVFINDRLRDTFIYITWVGLCGCLSLFGIAGNITNIIVYRRLGLKESINLSLFILSAFDLCTLILFIYAGVCLAPHFYPYSDITSFITELQLVLGGSQRMICIRVSIWIIALVALERCVCIIKPLKVKAIFTPRRSVTIIIVISVILFSASVPHYTSVRVAVRYFQRTNISRLTLVKSSKSNTYSVFAALVLQATSLVVIVAGNVLLVIALSRRTRYWKSGTFAASNGLRTSAERDTQSADNVHPVKESTNKTKKPHTATIAKSAPQEEEKKETNNVSNTERVTSQNARLAKMVLILSGMQLVTFVPTLAQFTLVLVEPEFGLSGRYRNYSRVFWGFTAVLEVCNASFNVLIYTYMSTRYRSALKEITIKNCQCDKKMCVRPL